MRGKATERDEVRVARYAAFAIGGVAILLSIFAQDLYIAFLVALAFAVAASANLPTIVYSLFWRRFNTSGALWSMYGGLISCMVLIIFSPVVSGKVDAKTGKSLSMIKDTGIDFSWFPLDNPGLISIPLAFLLGYIGTVVSKREPEMDALSAEMEVRSLTGYGAEKAVVH
jgi:cation/acetate symporter